MMCCVNEKNGDLTGLAARFIAETNAFLDQFWAHRNVRWPLKPCAVADPEAPGASTSSACRVSVPDEPVVTGGLAAVPELVARIRRLNQSRPNGGNGNAADVDGEPCVYVILLLMPEESPCPSAESIIKSAGIYGVRSHNGDPISVDAAPPPRDVEPVKRPRRRHKATSAGRV